MLVLETEMKMKMEKGFEITFEIICYAIQRNAHTYIHKFIYSLTYIHTHCICIVFATNDIEISIETDGNKQTTQVLCMCECVCI